MIVQHQVPAVIITMAEHAGFAGQLLSHRRPFLVERPPNGGRNLEASVCLEKMFDEEIQLPRELVAIERHAEWQEVARLELLSALLQPVDELDRLFVERVVLDRLRHA